MAEKEKKKKKIKERRAEEDEEAHPIKKKERRTSEKRERRWEEKYLKEEERRKKAESPEIEGESTSIRVDKGELVQLRKSGQLEEEIMQEKMVVTDDGEDLDITLLMRRHKENALQGSTVDPPILQDAVEEKEKRSKRRCCGHNKSS
ncbi:protein pxr1-like [Benincasa hispida]|uniref:protein pxr1-like n=1 Tax=Benincasa hispida TaxID=102211 RepID=UPI0019011EF4|nr:protein pxr1-like [Benincasa hispida]